MSGIMTNKLAFLRDAFHTNYDDDPSRLPSVTNLYDDTKTSYWGLYAYTGNIVPPGNYISYVTPVVPGEILDIKRTSIDTARFRYSFIAEPPAPGVEGLLYGENDAGLEFRNVVAPANAAYFVLYLSNDRSTDPVPSRQELSITKQRNVAQESMDILERDFYAYYSNLPKLGYSVSDHQYAFYCNMLGYDRTQPVGKSMADLEREYYLSLIGGSETDILVLENQFYAQTWSNWRPA